MGSHSAASVSNNNGQPQPHDLKASQTNAHGDVHAVKKGRALRTQRGDGDPVSPTASTHRWENKVGIQSDLDLVFIMFSKGLGKKRLRLLKSLLAYPNCLQTRRYFDACLYFVVSSKEERETGAVGTFSGKKNKR